MGSILFLAALAFATPIRFGGSGGSAVTGMAVDKDGNICVAGTTTSFDFPTRNAFQGANPGTRLVVTRDSGRTWQPVSGLPGTPTGPFTVGAVAVDPTNSQVLYVGVMNALQKSVDGGQTFVKLPQIFPAPAPNVVISYLVIDPQQPATIYAASIFGGRISKSTDGGKTWVQMMQGITTGTSVFADYLVKDPLHPMTLLAGLGGRDFITRDGAQNWSQVVLPTGYREGGSSFGALFDPTTPDKVYLYNTEGFFVSTDGARTVSRVVTPFRSLFGLSVGGPGVLYAATDAGLMKSTDGGANWFAIGPAGAGPTDRQINVDPSDPRIVVTETLFSQDGGATFSPISLGRSTSSLSFVRGTKGLAYAITTPTADAFVAKFSPAGEMLFATYLGGQLDEGANGLALDPDGNIYVTGGTSSVDFPLTANAYSRTPSNSFAVKISPDGKLLWSSYLDQDAGARLAVDAAGAVYFASSFRDNASFVEKLSADLKTRVYKTSVMNGAASGIAVDRQGNMTVVGSTSSTAFPATQGALQSTLSGQTGIRDGFVMKLDPSGGVIYATFLGGAGHDQADAVVLDQDGNAYIVGTTGSKDFPVTAGAYQSALRSNCAYPAFASMFGKFLTQVFATDDLFVTKLGPSGSLIYSTYLGADCYENANSIAVDSAGNVWVAGRTDSNPFPVVAPFESGPAENTGVGLYKSIVVKLDAKGATLLKSSYANAGDKPVVVTGPAGTYLGGAFGALTRGDDLQLPQAPILRQALLQRVPEETAPVTIQSIGNAYLTLNGPVTPGEIISIQADRVAPAQDVNLRFNPQVDLPTRLADTRVLFDGIAAPVMEVSAGRITAVTPMGLAGQPETSVQVEFQGNLSNPVTVEVVPVDPALLPLTPGSTSANARNEDGSQNGPSNPAAAGSMLTVFFTGGGVTTPSVPDGSITPETAPTPVSRSVVKVAGAVADTVELSAVPGFVAGLMKIKVKLPANIRGDRVLVLIESFGLRPADSPALTIAIR